MTAPRLRCAAVASAPREPRRRFAAALNGPLAAAHAESSLATFHALGVEIYPTALLLVKAFELRANLRFDDARYVVLARQLAEPLATNDTRLARAAAAIGVDVDRP